jgi:GT2 family glycosyltransferase/SAM-dependent methyltransferase
VLDLASGEGFGSAILAATADSVIGIDLDERTVAHSRVNYESEHLHFHIGDGRDLSRWTPDSFDVVVAFEMIEHVDEQDRVIEEAHRVLAPGGLLVMSTPDRNVYSDGTDQTNPFHVREMTTAEFLDKLGSHFSNVASWGQRTITGSAMSTLTGESTPESRTFFVSGEGGTWRTSPGLAPRYVVALASDGALPDVPADSTLADGGVQLLREADDKRRRTSEILTEQADELRAAVYDEQARYAELSQSLHDVRVDLHDVHVDLDHKQGVIATKSQELATAGAETRRLQDELDRTIHELAVVEGSVLWNLFRRARGRAYGALGGEQAFAVRAAQLTIRGVGRLLRTSPAAQATPGELAPSGDDGPQIVFPEFTDPTVSVIVPVYRNAELTRACLRSISERTTGITYEVIVVDDQADPASRRLLSGLQGARVITNDANLGYLRSVNRAAQLARGRWLVLANNDIEVGVGWLEALLSCARSADDIAVVTPKYLYPDQSINEAGAIVFKDATGYNYGRGQRATDCYYNFRRDVDYGSAAALLVRMDIWREVGGYDERYLPMYYEDVDLCFAARERGMRVVYEPRAEVTHVEGASAGTDISSGHKRHQELNREKFAKKWRERLMDQLPPGPDHVRRASDRGAGSRVLIVDHLVPLRDRDAGSLRMWGIIEALIENGARVTFLPDDLAPREPYVSELQELGVSVLYGEVHVQLELATIASELALVICSRPHTASRWLDTIRGVAEGVPVVYDTVDLHWVRETRRSALRGPISERLPPRAAALRELELAMIRATDLTVVASDAEQMVVEREVPGKQVRVIPTYHDIHSTISPASGREGVVYVGSFDHPPNVDAALALVTEIMPLIWRTLPEVTVKIIGTSPPPQIEALASSLVTVTGWVKDIEPLLDSARALVAPLTYGAGMKGKVTQALACGLPVVTTPVGAEGLHAHDGDQMMIGSTPSELAERTVRLLSDDELWNEVSQAGLGLARDVCSPLVFADRLAELLEWAREQTASQRRADGSSALTL